MKRETISIELAFMFRKDGRRQMRQEQAKVSCPINPIKQPCVLLRPP